MLALTEVIFSVPPVIFNFAFKLFMINKSLVNLSIFADSCPSISFKNPKLIGLFDQGELFLAVGVF